MCKNQDYCYVKMPNVHNEIVKYNQDQKSMKIPFNVHADAEST